MARARARRLACGQDSRVISEGPETATSLAEPSSTEIVPCETQWRPAAVQVDPPKVPRSPPVLMLVVDEEEEVEFCESPECERSSVALTDEPPFDPPDVEELLNPTRAAEGDDAVALAEALAFDDDEEPPFDPVDAEELAPPSLSTPIVTPSDELVLAPANETARASALGPGRLASSQSCAPPAPAIRIYFSWDEPRAADFFRTVADDPRLARTETFIARGGLDGAAIHCAAHERPDLLVIDTTLRGAAMLASLDRLLETAGRDTRIVVIGAVNDVALLRELAHRGVDQYLVWPVTADELVGAACGLFAAVDKARVIAVVGARGGIGASTVARNLAWCIAERQRARVTLVDLDLPFGTAAFDFKLEPLRSLADALAANAWANDVALECVGVRRSQRLTILPAPATPHCTNDLETETVAGLIAAARRLSTFVVLDLPHQWSPWVKHALVGADEVVLVSSPDLASLRNTDNIAKQLKNERKSDPVVVLSMVGVPKRPEVPLKEFAEALGISPSCALAFEPNIFGAAAATGQVLAQIAPESKAAAQLEALATQLTGRACVDLLQAEPRIFEEPPAPSASVAETNDPFAHALVNPVALRAPEDMDVEAPADPLALAPLELMRPAPLEPDYIARARAAALRELDAIESSGRPARRGGLFGRFAGAAAGLLVSVSAGVAYLQTQSEAAAPASARAAAAAPIVTPTPAQLAAEYRAAVRLIEQGAPELALAAMQRLAEAGFVMAQYRLAKMYEHGAGVSADLAQARLWTERAAAGGNRNAMHDLGVYYARGEGAPRDEATALRWFQQAAELGLADSQFNLGLMYEQGRGAEADAGEALFWFMLAARRGDAAAAERARALEGAVSLAEREQVMARLDAFQPGAFDSIANGVFAPQAAGTAVEPNSAD